ncbi:MAG: hypothetical protein WAO75_11185 [Atribacterales bacterium]
MKIKERINKLEEKIGKEEKPLLLVYVRPRKEAFIVTIDNEEIGTFPTEEEVEKVIDERAKGANVLIIEAVYNEREEEI